MLGKLFSSVIVTALCLIPFWLYLVVRWLLEPDGFLAEFLVLGLGVYVLGGIQFFLIILWFVFLLSIWAGSNDRTFRR